MLSDMTFWEWVQVAGYFAEVVGIGLVVWEILDRSQQLAAFETSQREIEGFVEPMVFEVLIEASGTVTSAIPPTLEERVDALERRVEQDLPRRLVALEKAAAKTGDEQTRRIVRPMQASFQSDLAKVTEALRGSLSGRKRALVSVALLLLGLALQGVGSIKGAHDATAPRLTAATAISRTFAVVTTI